MGSIPDGDSGFFRGFPNDLGFSYGSDGSSSSVVLYQKRSKHARAPSRLEGGGALDAKTAMAMKSHCEAERRRRERINGHLAVLRSMVPCADKLDKAALLAEVIGHVKKLKRNAVEISKGYTIPSDADEVRVEVQGDAMSTGSFMVKACLCCEDRPWILADLRRTLHSLQLQTVRAEISTLGGRIKNVFVMTSAAKNSRNIDRHHFVASVHQALKSILERINSRVDLLPRAASANKRQKVSLFESSSSVS